MKKLCILLFISWATCFSIAQNIVFDGTALTSYYNQTVTFQQTLHVCGQYNHNLYLSYERLRQPEELAIYGTAAYDSINAKNEQAILTCYCPDMLCDTIRSGATLTNISALVTGDRSIRINGNFQIANNTRPIERPNVGGRLIVCGANLEYYCPAWQNTYGAESDAEFAVQHCKTMKALTNIGADIFAFAELQQGAIALDSIVRGLNSRTEPGRYAYVDDGNEITNTYTKVGFVYRADKVHPVLVLGHPYGAGAYENAMKTGYHRRMLVQAFEENATGERFVIAINHFKSKSGGTEANNYYNGYRVENAQYLTDFLSTELANNYYQDDDILILGDLNCGTMEEPIRNLQSAGFENQLTRFAPNEYSYVFDDEVEYLDHALASPSMAQQITGVQPYHINADESYKFYYTYNDTTMYRYADHDPIIVGLNLASTPDNTCQDIDYHESFTKTFGSFEAKNLMGDGYWYTNDTYECSYINGYNTGANEDWLISPTFDMTNHNNGVVHFEHLMGYGTQSTWGDRCKLFASSDYNGNISQSSWNEIPISNIPTESWTWEENTISIPTYYEGGNITFAFRYTCPTSDVPAWEIKNFAFSALCTEDTTHVGINNPNTIHKTEAIVGTAHAIHFQFDEPTNASIYDLQGRLVTSLHKIQHTQLTLKSGCYIVKTEHGCYKVIVP